MKKILGILAIAVALTACGNSASETTTTDSTATTDSTTMSSPSTMAPATGDTSMTHGDTSTMKSGDTATRK